MCVGLFSVCDKSTLSRAVLSVSQERTGERKRRKEREKEREEKREKGREKEKEKERVAIALFNN